MRRIEVACRARIQAGISEARHAPFEGTFKLWEDKGQTFKSVLTAKQW